ncbi:DUF559 domain-containing protein [Microbispora sp. RL4-1S]|uniref:DUF559 domain-containing protein n=1 Tax=Microbispora oryzae TaxID=2806554 RepID=A0A940WK82_9ACTN|nr:DUF559 domain-containing protein [Microbispora oryzae]MBP2703035.1 DUF559 domain-containing protein [Microbispora oryzae]
MTRSWAELPTGRAVRLVGPAAEPVSLPAEPLPPSAPAVVAYTPPPGTTADVVRAVLAELDRAAAELFPAWLPGAEDIRDTGGGSVPAIRALARALAHETTRAPAHETAHETARDTSSATAPESVSAAPRFGPFLADLAERSLRASVMGTGTAGTDTTGSDVTGSDVTGTDVTGTGVMGTGVMRTAVAGRGTAPPEIRAAGLARVVATGLGRDRTAILMPVPAGLSHLGEHALVAACEWLAFHGGLGVWLTGAPFTAVDRLETITLDLPVPPGVQPAPAAAGPLIRLVYPPVAGRPHPASRAERALEAALRERPWAAGRIWNQTHRSSPLAPLIRVDLMWRAERCAVEIDGPEHRTADHFEADRRRDMRLQLDGFTVLRFTNDQLMTQMDTVLHDLERFLHGRRSGTFEGSTSHA